MLHSKRSSLALFLPLVGALLIASGPAGAKSKSAPEWFQYVASYTCGGNVGDALRVVRGEYATAVNVYNASGETATFHKNLALVYPPSAQAPGEVSDPIEDVLATGTALQIDCLEIRNEFYFPNPPPNTGHVQGFLVIESDRPLHVEAVYTAAGSDGEASIDVERIAEQRVVPRPFVRPTKLSVCHFPPGNPGNAHTIVIDAAALPAHKAHGDTLGSCSNE